MSKPRTLTLKDIGLIAGTRVALGMGIGLLISGKMSRYRRRSVGWSLVTAGALTTIPIAIGVLKNRPITEKLVSMVA